MVLGCVDLPVSRPLSGRDLTILGIRLSEEWPRGLAGVLVESYGVCLWLESHELVLKGRPGQQVGAADTACQWVGFVILCYL